MTIIENVEEAVYQDIKEQEGSDHCVVTLDDHEVDFGYVSPVYWREGQIHTD
jgi:hypothetical protein